MNIYLKPSLRGNAEIVARISKLIPRLASNHDGEVVATVAAIKRTLEASGFDFNDLASSVSAIGLEAALVPAAMPFVSPAEDWSDIIRQCFEHRSSLSAKERAFVESMIAWDAEPTEKQQKWLLDIAHRLRIEV